MFFKITLGSPKTLSFILLLLIAPHVSGAKQGVRRRNKQTTSGFEEITLNGKNEKCSQFKCASACVGESNPCSPDMFCDELLIAGNCCPEAKCRKCTSNLKAQCPDPCENFTCGDSEVCRAIEFEEYCCPKAICSATRSDVVDEAIPVLDEAMPAPDENPNSPINLCEGVVCSEDPCNCPTDLDGYDGCGYECNYDPFPSFLCCPTSLEGCIARCDGPCPSDLNCADPCENFFCGVDQVCRPVQFEGRCCPKAVCSDVVEEIIPIDPTITPPNSCEGVVCEKDPCNCPQQSDPYCGYDHCDYSPFSTNECCPTNAKCVEWCY
ncbi:predicted protein [Chaetoceros tenuissimus]|uniref:Uncharacterized protein n=1 Tax=Chaetoceros tenuissimus TaxID=426638 RepID=A0AAD3CH19_9STRA|nr:predicted protein [Chaetoceros tenuissimus]